MSKNESDVENKPNGSGITRVFKAMRCSKQGFSAAYKYEAAFKQELWLSILLTPIALYIAESGIQLALLLSALLLLLLVEVINSAIEAVVDRIGLEHHVLSGRAKDLGSSAVFVAVCLVIVIWAGVIFDNYFA